MRRAVCAVHTVLSSKALDGAGAVPSVADEVWKQETVGGVGSVADSTPCVSNISFPFVYFI